MYERHWGFSYNDDDYLMHYGIKGMKWRNHVYKKYNKLKKRFKRIFGSKSSKKKKVAKEKVSPEIKKLRGKLNAALGKPIKRKNAESYKGKRYFDYTLQMRDNFDSYSTWNEYCSVNLRKILSTTKFANYKKSLSKQIEKAYPGDPKKRRALKLRLDDYIENQARDELFSNWQFIAEQDEIEPLETVKYEYEYYD